MPASRNPELSAQRHVDGGKQWLRRVRAACKGKTRKQAAEVLGVDRTTLYRWLAQHPEILRQD